MMWRRLFGVRKKPSAEDRFFYHSFPRRGHSTDSEIEKGCKILSLICEAGLLLAPEVVEWSTPHVDGSPPRELSFIQRRISFTELAPRELTGHAREFGSFALEFDIDTLKRMGAMPVFYIPRKVDTKDEAGVTSLGSTLVVQLIDTMLLMMRLAGMKKNLDDPELHGPLVCDLGFQNLKTFSFDVPEARAMLEALSYALTPFEMMEHALSGLLSCFYPADNLRHNEALAYYRQREWRIAWNFAVRGKEAMRRPSDEVVKRLLEIDSCFFGRDFETASGTRRRADEAYIFPGFGSKRIIEMVNRVVVPRAGLAAAKVILTRAAPSIPVVCIENMAW